MRSRAAKPPTNSTALSTTCGDTATSPSETATTSPCGPRSARNSSTPHSSSSQPLPTSPPAPRAAADAIHRFEQATGITPGTAPEPVYTRTEAKQAAHAAFERLSQYIKLDHRHDRQFVTQAFLAFLDNPDSPYPYKSHNPDDEEDGSDEQPEPELSPEESGERENSLLYWLGPRPDTAPHPQADNR